jgi:hypothetical protein
VQALIFFPQGWDREAREDTLARLYRAKGWPPASVVCGVDWFEQEWRSLGHSRAVAEHLASLRPAPPFLGFVGERQALRPEHQVALYRAEAAGMRIVQVV